jgi:TRAP-type mannitol/chloroaromatic compound transport system permease large subunit
MTGAVFSAILLAGVPISFVLMITGSLYIWLSGNGALYGSFMQQLFQRHRELWTAGHSAVHAGRRTDECRRADKADGRHGLGFLGGVRGGLAYINLIANMMMASIMGSAVAQIAVMSRVMVPEMEKQGYDRSYAAALTAAGGLLSPIIPPSMLFVIFGVLAQIAIGDLFIAGIIPGLLLSAAFFISIALLGFLCRLPQNRESHPQPGHARGGRQACRPCRSPS